MRRSLGWALVAAVVLSAVALWTGDTAPSLIAAVEPQVREHARSLDAVAAATNAERDPLPPLPARLDAVVLRPATRDVFAPKASPAPPLPQPVVAAVPAAASPPTPQAPPLNLRFMGSMVDPTGKRLVYLARGDTAVPVGVGDRVDEGYVVESLTRDAVVLVYPSLNARTTVPIPPEPQQ